MSESVLGGAVMFMEEIGIFDTVLPFLLVFTLIFAFLEKTKVLGTDKYKSSSDGEIHEVTKKNLNSMIAFVTAFFVVASTQLVALISEVISNFVLIILLIFSFLLAVGSFSEETDKPFYLQGNWATTFQVIAFLAITLIFLNALGWLEIIINFIESAWQSEAIAAILLVAVVIGLMVFITWDKKPGGNGKDKD